MGGGGGLCDFTGSLDLRKADKGPEGGIGGRMPGTAGAVPEGGFGAEKLGGFGAEAVCSPGSDIYEESEFAPVSMPPRLFLNFGIPPANSPPSCGADSIPELVASREP